MSRKPFAQPKVPIEFMGRHFPNLEEFRREFPAFAGDDAVRAIRAGCQTVLEVERYCWRKKNAARLASNAAAKSSQFAAKFAFGS